MTTGINSDWQHPAYDPPCQCSALRKEIVNQRKEIVSLLHSVGALLVQDMDTSTYPKWIRDRLSALGEEV